MPGRTPFSLDVLSLLINCWPWFTNICLGYLNLFSWGILAYKFMFLQRVVCLWCYGCLGLVEWVGGIFPHLVSGVWVKLILFLPLLVIEFTTKSISMWSCPLEKLVFIFHILLSVTVSCVSKGACLLHLSCWIHWKKFVHNMLFQFIRILFEREKGRERERENPTRGSIP